MGALTEVVEAGKARFIGFSEWPAERIEQAIALPGVARFVSSQPQYSALYRVPEREMFPLCAQHGIGQVVWSPLAQGVLSGKYRRGEPPPGDARAAGLDGPLHGPAAAAEGARGGQRAGADRRRGGPDDGPARARVGAAVAVRHERDRRRLAAGAGAPRTPAAAAPCWGTTWSPRWTRRWRASPRSEAASGSGVRARRRRYAPLDRVRRAAACVTSGSIRHPPPGTADRVPELVEALLRRRPDEPPRGADARRGPGSAPARRGPRCVPAPRPGSRRPGSRPPGSPPRAPARRSARGRPASGSCCRPRTAAASTRHSSSSAASRARVRRRSIEIRTWVSSQRSR